MLLTILYPFLGTALCEGARCGFLASLMGYWTVLAFLALHLEEETMDAEEFLKEAAVMKYVRHPNLVCVCVGGGGGGGGDVWVGHGCMGRTWVWVGIT